jgi:molecular chaperone GrpE
LSEQLEELPQSATNEGDLSSQMLTDTLGAMRVTLNALERRVRASRSADEANAQKEWVALIIDIRERLLAAQGAAESALSAAEAAMPNSWPMRGLALRSTNAVLEGYREILKGYAITLERLEDALSGREIHEVEALGARFDPEEMKIVDIEDRRDIEEGTVLAVYRRGYQWRGSLLQPAEVKVARRVLREGAGSNEGE